MIHLLVSLFYVLQHISKKSNPTESAQLHHTVRGKRVVAPQQPGRLTRSRMLLASEAPPIQDTSEVNVDATQAELPIQNTSLDAAANTHTEITTQDASGAQEGKNTGYCT
jgi:hypothetical protein